LKQIKIVRLDVSCGTVTTILDYVAEERPLLLFLNRTHYATIFCTPSKMKELAIGYLLSEGVIESIQEVREIILTKNRTLRINLRVGKATLKRLKLIKHLSRVILSGCGNSGPRRHASNLHKIDSDMKVRAEVVLDCVNRLNKIAETFRKTGGVHVAAIYHGNGICIALAEDIGRHNAVDKIIGVAAGKEVNFSDCLLAVSGRLTGDIVSKAAKMGLPLVASLSAPTDSGVSVARKVGLTLIGFARGKHMNIYNSPGRILT
jgi:FdhD protein